VGPAGEAAGIKSAVPSLREPARRALLRLIAHVLILALVAGLLPADAHASLTPPPIGSRALGDLAPEALPSVGEVFACVVVVAADPVWLTKSAFGELLAHTGSDPQPYAFAGEPYDPNSGFQYHRARWMDPRVGRFTGMDPYRGVPEEPATLHRYLYTAGDPVNRTDPTGLDFSLSVAFTSFAVMSSIASIASVAPAGEAAVFSKTRIPTELQLPGTGVGPIILRIFTTGAMRNARRATEVIGGVKRDINRFSTVPGFFGNFSPSDTPFKCVAGPNCGEITQNNIYSIDGPFAFNPYVKATTVTNDSFEFTTMKGHPEAGQVKFSANDLAAGTLFSIRVWGHPSTRANSILYGLAGHWTQTQIWENFVENVRTFATSR
jgi:RHS repeat-associated protein